VNICVLELDVEPELERVDGDAREVSLGVHNKQSYTRDTTGYYLHVITALPPP
jgi:hypothetical protein